MMTDRQRVVLSLVVMGVVVTGAAGAGIATLYRAGFEQQRQRLSEIVGSQARLIEALARFNRKHPEAGASEDRFSTTTLSVIRTAYEASPGFGKVELTLARREGDSIVFLVHLRGSGSQEYTSVPFSSAFAEPMRLALSGDSGTVVAPDYRGRTVLAAYEPVEELGIGIVAKIDLAEVRTPFAAAAAAAVVIGVLLLGFAVLVFRRSGMVVLEHSEEREQKYRALFDSSTEGVALLSGNLVVDCNAQLCRMFGYDRDEILGHRAVEFAPATQPDGSDTAAMAAEQIAAASAGERQFAYWQYRRKDGVLIDTWTSLSPVTIEGRTLIMSSLHDITERRRAEAELSTFKQALEESERRFEILFGQSPDGYILLDPQGRIVEANAQTERFFGTSRAGLIGRNIQDMPGMKREDRERAADRLGKRSEGLRLAPTEYVFHRAGGEKLTVEAQLHPVTIGGRSLMLLIARDVSARKLAEEELRARANQQAAVAELGQSGLADLPIDRLMETAVTVVARTLELEYAKILELLDSGEELVLRAGVGWRQGLVGKARVSAGVASQAGYTLAAHAPVIVKNIADETRFTAPALLEEHAVVSGISVVIHGPDKPFGVLAAHTTKPRRFGDSDIHFMEAVAGVLAQALERKRAEERVLNLNEELESRVSQRTAELEAAIKELEAFTSAVSHDLRQPLHSTGGFIGLLEEDLAGKLDERAKDYLARARNGLKNMARMIDDLLQLSRVSKARLERRRVNMSEMVLAVARELQEAAPERNVELKVEEDVVVSGDEGLLNLVSRNLLGNAWKFTRYRKDARVEFGVVGNGNGSRAYYVRDNGAGFDMSYADKLFSPFCRLHRVEEFEGTGIGLATVARIVHRHGGKIWCEAEEDRGATFYFTLGSDARERTPGNERLADGAPGDRSGR